jgi:hypothetical protein
METSSRRRVIGAVTAVAALVTAQLTVTAPAAMADDDPLCYTATNSSAWYDGPSASKIYDARTSLATSRKIPDGLIDDRYVPQGLAALSNWNGTGEDILLISAYEDENGNKVPDGPSAIFGVVASGSRANTGLGRMLISSGHVGGIAVYKGFVYVGTEKTIRAYPVREVKRSLDGPNNNTVHAAKSVYDASYTVGFLGSGGGHLWAGRFSETETTKLNRYGQLNNDTGELRYQTQFFAPKKTQGVAVTADHVIFSTSYGRNNRSNIWVMPRGATSRTDANSYCFRAPSMTEGVTLLNGRVWINYESKAYTYNWEADKPRNRIGRVHSATISSVTGLMGQAD